MPVYIWDLTPGDIKVPGVGGTAITPTSLPVTSTQVAIWLLEGAGIVNGLMQKAGMQPTAEFATANPEAKEIARAAIKAYATKLTAGVIGHETIYDQAKADWDEWHARIGTVPQVLGNAYQGTRNLDVDNIDDEPAEPWDWATMAGNVW